MCTSEPWRQGGEKNHAETNLGPEFKTRHALDSCQVDCCMHDFAFYRFARYYRDAAHVDFRTQIKTYGIRFDVTVNGKVLQVVNFLHQTKALFLESSCFIWGFRAVSHPYAALALSAGLTVKTERAAASRSTGREAFFSKTASCFQSPSPDL